MLYIHLLCLYPVYREDGSFAIWRGWESDNVRDLSIFDEPSILKKLHGDVVFVALNPSLQEGNTSDNKPLGAFHSGYPFQKDFKLCYALKGTSYEGSYITDLFKGLKEKDSSIVAKKYASNMSNVAKDILRLKEELRLVKPDSNPLLIAIGREVEKHLKKHLGGEYLLWEIPHYSSWSSKETYSRMVQGRLSKLDRIREFLNCNRSWLSSKRICYIPFGTKSIRKEQYSLSDSTTVLIPDSVTYVGRNAFSKKLHNPVNILYAGSIEQWDAVEVDDNIKTALCIYCLNGQKAYHN